MKQRTIISISVVAGLVVVALIYFLFAFNKQSADHSSTPTQAASQVQLTLNIDAPNYTEGTDSKFPLEIAGTNSTGEAVNTTVYVTLTDNQVSLPAGTYTVRASASPLLSKGGLYTLPEESTLDTSQTQHVALNYTPASTYDLKPAQIQAAKEAALASGMSADEVTKLSSNLDAASALVAYLPIFKDMQALDSGGAQHGMVNVSRNYDGRGHIVAKLEDFNADGTPELILGRAYSPRGLDLTILPMQVFGIKDGQAVLLTGLRYDGTSSADDGLNIVEANGPSFMNYDYSNNRIELQKLDESGSIYEIMHLEIDAANQTYVRVEANGTREAPQPITGMINTLIHLYPLREETGYVMYGDYLINLNCKAHGADFDTSSAYSFDPQTISGKIQLAYPSKSITVDRENKRIHIQGQMAVSTASNSTQLQDVDFECSYDDTSFFGTNIGSAPYYGKRRQELDEYLKAPGPGADLYIKDGHLLAMVATS